ncbi:MAG: enoyl-CoA hydratase/isomerase family protein [Deltaproteobacteria bacterium]|nr:enoyl-CoA hydratase/isomerase family protein [Deltaproteobacteria bacterium]
MRKVLFKKSSKWTGRIILNNPARKNAMDLEMASAFCETVDVILKDTSDLRLLIVEGSDGVFSSGGDLSMLEGKSEEEPFEQLQGMLNYYRQFASLIDIPIPTVALVEGWCVGAGVCLTALCDIRISVESAKFSVPFINLALHPGLGSTHLLVQELQSFGDYMLLTGFSQSASRLHQLGFIHELAQSRDEAEQFIEKIEAHFAQIPSEAIALVLHTLRERKKNSLEKTFFLEARAQAICYSSEWFKQTLKQKLSKS